MAIRQHRYEVAPRVGSRLDMLMRGEITVDDLTEEELLTGILNDKNGARHGRPPNLIPREFHQAVVRRVIEMGDVKLRGAYQDALNNLIAMSTGPTDIEPFGARVDPTVLKAAQWLVERVGGKTPDRVEHSGEIKSHEKIRVYVRRGGPPEDEDDE